MPSLAEALRFVRDPATGTEKLRRACALLHLDHAGTEAELRARLLAHLEPLAADQDIVCLNPRLIGDDPAAGG